MPLVDLDPQAALSASAGVPIAHLTTSIYQVLLDDSVDPLPVITTTASGVDVLLHASVLACKAEELARAWLVVRVPG